MDHIEYSNTENPSNNVLTGFDHLRNPHFNKGLAFGIAERQVLGIYGLLPPRVKTQNELMEQCMILYGRERDDLSKFMYLMDLLDRNEKLFYYFVHNYIEDLLPVIYTPTVGLACQNYSRIFKAPKGLFISIYDKGYVADVLKNWPNRDVRAIVVTDGERILGLGDLGAQGMGIPVGKLTLYTALASIKPMQCLPVTIDVGTVTQSLLDDKMYIGINEKRVTGQEYDDLIDEFMKAVVDRFGYKTLIQFEDFSGKNAFRFLKMYKNNYCMFNDDIQGTASVALAGLLAAIKFPHVMEKNRLSDHRILLFGAGMANLGIADICLLIMKEEGLSEKEGKKRLFLMDSKGLITTQRTDLSPEKAVYAQEYKTITTLNEAVKDIKPSILIGAAGAGPAFTQDILRDMAKYNNRPIIFALSNPTDKSECTAEEAYIYTDGTALFASGSPFPPVNYNGKQFIPKQANNAYIFPGLTLGVAITDILHIVEEMFIESAKILATLVTKNDIEKGSLYPSFQKIHEITLDIAVGVAELAYLKGLAEHPRPKDLRSYIDNERYCHRYVSSIHVYPWPESK